MPVPYLSGLRLSDRRVVVVGAGRVAERRLDRLLESGAQIDVIAPEATETIAQLADEHRLRWIRRRFEPGDLAAAWYVLVATADRACNEQVSVEAESGRIFCVRADDRQQATAWTPAGGAADGIQIGVLAGGDHRRSRRIRDRLVQALTKIIADDDDHRAA
jgi:uroporphyrin-III C-methyltransferase/precorrin-2 dehydrogenase/sirohydrochlorin ferrochelatase